MADRKSGIPDSVEHPAPPKNTIFVLVSIYYLSPIIPFNGKDFIKLIFRKTTEDKKIL